MPKGQQFIILPSSGLRSGAGLASQMLLEMSSAFHSSSPEISISDVGNMRVLDVLQETGAKLVEADAAAAQSLNESSIPLRAVPVVEYPRPRIRPFANFPFEASPVAGDSGAVAIACVDSQTGAPVRGATVIAFTNFAAKIGAKAITGNDGVASVRLRGRTIERLYVYGPPNFWGAYRAGVATADMTVPLERVDLRYVDCVRHYYGTTRFDPAAGVRVGVLDTGCDPHPDLNLQPGHATVTGEPDDSGDVDIHGTHVAGLIGAGGGLRGVAPGVPIYPYRVFPANGDGATNYAILKAMFLATADGCDVINLSLGGGPFDDVVAEAVQDARNQGMLVVVAAGNDGRASVSYPAAYPGAVAVSALGREGTFPLGSGEEADVLRPPQSQIDPAEFVASFSNVGPQICVTAPGVGALSTLPNGDYGPLSGTSMAAPVVAGAAASLLSRDPTILGMPRNRARSDAIFNLLVQNCVRRRFGQVYEGFGLPDPGLV